MVITDSETSTDHGFASFQSLGDGTWSSSSDNSIQILVDGNIRFGRGKLTSLGSSDTLALVNTVAEQYHDRGEDFLKEIGGSFRLALWDKKKQKLLVATDPFGTRPVYFRQANDALLFAPRLSCYSGLRIPREIDSDAVVFYLNHSFIPAPQTIYRGIYRLEPGRYLSWQNGRLSNRQYWELEYEEDRTLSVSDAAELVRSAVRDSVRSCLSAYDLRRSQIGAFLSGGTDSSTLVGLMTEITGQHIKTFSVGFSEKSYNELDYARVAAKHYNSQPHEILVTAEDAFEVLPLLAAELDEPFGNSSAIPTYFCVRKAKDVGVTLMFAGDGGDELFGGNDRYLAEKWFYPFDSLPCSSKRAMVAGAEALRAIGPLSKIRRYVEQASLPNPQRFFRYQLFISDHLDEFLTSDFKAVIERNAALRVPEHHYAKTRGLAPLNRLLYMDMKMCIGDNDLFKVNQMAKVAGVNVCYPYLSRELAELTGKIPANFKVRQLQKRYIFKKAFKKLLPPEILRKKKHGFGMPTGEWLRHHSKFRELARSLLLEPRSLRRGYFNRKALERLLKLHDEERSSYYGTYIWYFMMLELWHRCHYDKAQAV